MSDAANASDVSTNGLDHVDLLDRAASATARLIDGVGADGWHAATPCEDMDLLALVEHLVTGLDQFAGVGLGDPMVDPSDRELWASLSPESADTAYRQASVRMHDAWSSSGAVEQVYEMPWGSTPGMTMVDFMVIEAVTHGWDLMQATGQPCPFDDDLVAATFEMAREYDDPTIRVPTMFGAAVSVPETAPLIDRLAGFLGRHPDEPIRP